MIKIAYDISILGMGYINPKARTGIFRVVESLFLELIKKQEFNQFTLKAVALNNRGSFWDDRSTKLYLQNTNRYLEQYFFSPYCSRLNLDNLCEQAVQWQRSLIQATVNDKIFFYKLAQVIKFSFELLAKIDINICFTEKDYKIYHSSYFPLPSSAIIGHLPRILTIYDLIPLKFPEFVTPKVYSLFNKTLNSINKDKDWILCISQHTKNDFCDYTGMNPERVFVTPLAAAAHFYPITDPILIPSTLKRYQIPNAPYLLSICTLEPRKNLSFLIRCFSRIIQSHPALDLNLVLVGVSGWKNAEIFQSAKENSALKNRIIFTGYVPDQDLSAIYSGATAFVYPSLYEGFGLPPLEAMQCGTPVITSNTSSLPEVVGNAAVMIDPTYEDELCHAMIEVINNQQLRHSLSKKGVQQASQFSWSRCAEETIQVYRTAANA